MYPNYAAPLGVALSALLAAGPAGAADSSGPAAPVYREHQNPADLDPATSDEPAGTLVLS